MLMRTNSFGVRSQRESPPHEAVASLNAAVLLSSNQRDSPPDKPGASFEVFTQPLPQMVL